jgi:hypothetical protein
MYFFHEALFNVTGCASPKNNRSRRTENSFLRAVGATLEALFLLPPFAASTNR